MTCEVDLGGLGAALAELAACQRELVGIAVEVDRVLSYGSWREGCADMVTALAALRAIAADVAVSA